MYSLSESIQLLLHLQRPLPRSLTHDLRVGNKGLLELHEEFTDIVSEIQIWTFYETIDSQLSGSGSCLDSEVQFTAPLVSIKSAIAGVRQEHIYSSLQSDHAHCASFGITNPRTLSTYLQDLAAAIYKAEALSRTRHCPLNLKEKVKVEVIGFYEDPDASLESDVRLYVAKCHLGDFLQKGPESCLEERLRRAPKRPGSRTHASVRRWAHGAVADVQDRFKGISRSPGQERPASPGILLTEPSTLGELPPSTPPKIRPHSLTIPVDSLSRPRRPSSIGSNITTSALSEPVGQRETSSLEAASNTHRDPDERPDLGQDRTGLGIHRTSRTGWLSKAMAMQDLTAGFSRPNTDRRKFMWIHLPFTNPLWVEVCMR